MKLDLQRILRVAQDDAPPSDSEEGPPLPDLPGEDEEGGGEGGGEGSSFDGGGGEAPLEEESPEVEDFTDVPPATLMFGEPIDPGEVPNRPSDRYVDSQDDKLDRWGIGGSENIDLHRVAMVAKKGE